MKSVSSYWQFWAALSAGFAALTAIFAKIGVDNINPDFATFVRTIIILLCLAAILTATGQFQSPGSGHPCGRRFAHGARAMEKRHERGFTKSFWMPCGDRLRGAVARRAGLGATAPCRPSRAQGAGARDQRPPSRGPRMELCVHDRSRTDAMP